MMPRRPIDLFAGRPLWACLSAALSLGFPFPAFGDPLKTQSLRDDEAAVMSDFRNEKYEAIQNIAIEFEEFEKSGQEALFTSDLYRKLTPSENISRLMSWTQQNENSDVAWTALGLCYIHLASDYGGELPPASLTRSAKEPVKEYLTQAQTCLEKASQLNPDNPYPLAYQIFIDRIFGAKEAVMEGHFQKAIQIQPACLSAYEEKGEYLGAKWYGSWERMKDFYMKSAEAAPPGSPVRLLVIHYHTSYGLSLPKEQRKKYWSDPGVWNPMRDEYETFLKAHPDYDKYRCEFAWWADYVGDKPTARAQFKLLDKVKGPVWNLGGWWGSEQAYRKARSQY